LSKIAIISDVHFGCKSNNERYLTIAENFFKETLATVLRTKSISDVRIIGDLFDNRNTLNVRTLNAVTGVFHWYQTHMPSVHFKISLGNHDIYYHNRTDINSLECLREFQNVTIIDKVYREELDGKKLITFPWIIKDSETEVQFKEIKLNSDIWDLCLGHFEVSGFQVAYNHVHDGGYGKGDFSKFKKVFSGHFHLRNTEGNITYIGCPYQLNWGDYGDQKGIHIWDSKTEEVEFIPNLDSPVFVRLTVDDFLNKRKEKLKSIKGNFVKLVIDSKYKEKDLLTINQFIENNGCLTLTVENHFIEELNGEEVGDIDISRLSDPMSFLFEFINNLEIDEESNEINKETLLSYIKENYAKIER
jgi:DNA repair exonuclease SbcCD nuclease subunit